MITHRVQAKLLHFDRAVAKLLINDSKLLDHRGTQNVLNKWPHNSSGISYIPGMFMEVIRAVSTYASFNYFATGTKGGVCGTKQNGTSVHISLCRVALSLQVPPFAGRSSILIYCGVSGCTWGRRALSCWTVGEVPWAWRYPSCHHSFNNLAE